MCVCVRACVLAVLFCLRKEMSEIRNFGSLLLYYSYTYLGSALGTGSIHFDSAAVESRAVNFVIKVDAAVVSKFCFQCSF